MVKVAVVTGSNKGLGYGTVKLLLRQFPDWHVYMTARDEKRGREAVELMKQETGGLEPKFHQLDIDDVKSIEAFRDFLKATYPDGINVLVNNAGIMPKIAHNNADGSYYFDDEASKRTVQTGHFGYRNVLRELFPLVAKNGRVVNVSSGLGQSFFEKCSDATQQQFSQAKTLEDLDAIAENFKAIPFGDLMKVGYMKVDPGLLFHDDFRLGDIYPIGLTHLTITLMSKFHQQKADEANSGIVVVSICPGRVKSDMNPTGLLTPEEAARHVMAGVNLPDDTEFKGGYIVQSRPQLDWKTTPTNTGEVKHD